MQGFVLRKGSRFEDDRSQPGYKSGLPNLDAFRESHEFPFSQHDNTSITDSRQFNRSDFSNVLASREHSLSPNLSPKQSPSSHSDAGDSKSKSSNPKSKEGYQEQREDDSQYSSFQ